MWMNEAGYYGLWLGVMPWRGAPLSYHPLREGETLPPTPRLQSYPPPCETEVQGVLRTD